METAIYNDGQTRTVSHATKKTSMNHVPTPTAILPRILAHPGNIVNPLTRVLSAVLVTIPIAPWRTMMERTHQE